MAQPTEAIPVFKGKAAKWLSEYLESATHKRTAAQARRDKEQAAKIKPLKCCAELDGCIGHDPERVRPD